jgi:hypothetical protein
MLRIRENSAPRRVSGVRNPLRLTALLYLKEALVRERYEECAEIVALAKEFGAAAYEIDDLLEDPRRTPG